MPTIPRSPRLSAEPVSDKPGGVVTCPAAITTDNRQGLTAEINGISIAFIPVVCAGPRDIKRYKKRGHPYGWPLCLGYPRDHWVGMLAEGAAGKGWLASFVEPVALGEPPFVSLVAPVATAAGETAAEAGIVTVACVVVAADGGAATPG